MTFTSFIIKAERALETAKLLLMVEDIDGACNRAYYAMFEAARAALSSVEGAPDPLSIRTHNGLITAFGLHLVKTGRVSHALGVGLNKVERLRLLADYSGEPVSIEDVQWAVDQAAAFVLAIRALEP